MEIIRVKLTDLKLIEDNIRMHPRRQIEEYKRSLDKFGQTKNAVIDEDNYVLIGNGLVIAATELGWDEIGAIRRTDLSENDKLKLMVSDNKIFGLGVDNLDAIDNIFQRLQGDLDIPGYDESTLKSMVAEAEVVTEELIRYGQLSESEVTSIRNRPAATIAPVPQSHSDQPENAERQTPVSSNEKSNDVDLDNCVSLKCPKCGEELWLSKDALRQLLS